MKVRVILGILTFGMFFMYQMSRFNINIAIVTITKEELQNNATTTTQLNSKPLILGAIFYVCWITELLGTFLFAKFGCRLVMTIAFLTNALTCFLFPIAYHLHPICAFLVRAIQGLALGTTFPAMAWLSSRWIPKNERARFMSAFHGTAFGASFTNLIGGIIIDKIGWSYLFYTTGILSIIWVTLWWPQAYDSPSTHPRITKEEFEYLKLNVEADTSSRKSSLPVPWLSIFTSKPFWAIFILFFSLMWFTITLAMQMPTYFDSVHSLNIKTNGLLLCIPDLFKLVVGIKFPMVVDKLITKGTLTVSTARKLSIGVGYIIPGFLLSLIAFFGDQHVGIAGTLLILAIAINGAGSSSVLANIVDISPNYSGIIMGIVKTAANIPGVLSPILVKYMLDDGNVKNWRTIFLVTATLLIINTIIYLYLSSADVQSWNEQENVINIEENVDLMENTKAVKIVDKQKVELET